jgi:hypothetical protein
MSNLSMSFLGHAWAWGGTICWLHHPGDDHQARVFVDDLGGTYVDIRRKPEGGGFHSERVEAYRVYNGWQNAVQELRERGYDRPRYDQHMHRVRERDF